MKSVVIEQFGASSTITSVGQNTPTPADDEVLVRVKSASVNPVDIKNRQGGYKSIVELLASLGIRFTGIIENVGRNVRDLCIGDEVSYIPDPAENEGIYATHHVEKASVVARRSQRIVKGGLSPQIKRRCRELMGARLSEDISLAELATEARLSPFHFSRMFKYSFGVPPRVYLTQMRIEKACKLLVLTDLPITDIALNIGYSSSQALSRVFSKYLQMSPSVYRQASRVHEAGRRGTILGGV